MTRQLHFVGYCCVSPTWHNNGAWRHAESDAVNVMDPSRYEHIAKILEEGKFDGLFFVDCLSMFEAYGDTFAADLRYGGQMYMLEPMQILAAMARVTKNIGLAATMSTTFYHPYHIARQFATLDHLSGGRAGWNVVTSANNLEAQNFGMDKLLDKAVRYDQADEALEACNALWNSWDEGALLLDQEKGLFADPDKVRYANYAGKYVKTRGPLQTPRSPQGHPVIMQAGSSDRGREFAARWAEMVFTNQRDKAGMQAFYSDMKGRVDAAGRNPDHCAILPALDFVIGETESIAKERADYINSLVNAELGVADISNSLYLDLSSHPLDQKVDDLDLSEGAKGIRGIFDLILGGSKGKTLRDAGQAWGESQMVFQFVGTPAMIADHMQDMLESSACDGFIVTPKLSPSSYISFVRSVVPELQRRGIYKKDYTGRTFRENLRSGI
ncbi:LLM class flavin-dependent oxidoreductase [Mesorhizobium sp. B3-1-3]|uniref:LLM class flavin-dependent oxidoreductase n=1 Tax=unclassified Mesorhizobium TaxID=325217 RepID=UPI00112BDB49|nr:MULTISPECIES: LLM class flavin-dependent oxidoreductase [unclassified Mesorhizobium]TPI57357.1 LLM class flavin-dependent oxidoreductase [Mesorhizobium sp. B3-1-8]TPI63510.1 LLM class flavin-dependent oxidoreductase [Mesorhizobium sp. B3-1-3]